MTDTPLQARAEALLRDVQHDHDEYVEESMAILRRIVGEPKQPRWLVIRDGKEIPCDSETVALTLAWAHGNRIAHVMQLDPKGLRVHVATIMKA